MLTNNTWKQLKILMTHSGRVYNKYEHRMTLEGILYRMRTGVPWRNLPEEFGQWSTVFRRFNLWSKKGVLEKLFRALSCDNDPEWLFIDGSIIKAHQDGCGAASSMATRAILSKALSSNLREQGVELITQVRKNMKAKLLSAWDKAMLSRRFIIETINDQLKNVTQIEHSRHRSVHGFMLNLVGGLVAYCLKDSKPPLNINCEEFQSLVMA
ncbi:transposase [Pleionea mediterranea]|uniref:Transposase n=1 Tax=Pleionea mediterranea TaxID=523701 RepID=A0A316G0U8_9GAMM|nr:transposase [Pleionea mediterranea]